MPLDEDDKHKQGPSHHTGASHLLHVDLEGAQGLTLGTGTRLHLLVLGLEEGSQHEVTLVTVVLDHAELREDAGAAAHHAAGPDQLVQVELPEEDGQKKKKVCRLWKSKHVLFTAPSAHIDPDALRRR